MPSKVDRLYSKTLAILKKEVKHLSLRVIGDKLNPSDSKSLASYIKLLKDLKSMEESIEAAKTKTAKSAVTDDALEKALKESIKS